MTRGREEERKGGGAQMEEGGSASISSLVLSGKRRSEGEEEEGSRGGAALALRLLTYIGALKSTPLCQILFWLSCAVDDFLCNPPSSLTPQSFCPLLFFSFHYFFPPLSLLYFTPECIHFLIQCSGKLSQAFKRENDPDVSVEPLTVCLSV